MPTPFVITLPADDQQPRDEITAQLAPHAEVHAASPTFGFNEVKLVIEVIGDSIGILGNAAAIATFVLFLKDRLKQNRQTNLIKIARVGEPELRLAEADEATVRRIVGATDLKGEEQ